MMEKQEYIQPIIQSLGLGLETFICLSVPIGTGTGSGGGGDAKKHLFEELQEDDEEQSLSSISQWK